MHVKNDKVYISRKNMMRLYFGTHKIWEILRNEGAELVDARGRVPRGEHPTGPILGVDLMEMGLRCMTDFSHKFVTTNITALEEFAVKELRVNKLPTILVETPEMKEHRCGRR